MPPCPAGISYLVTWVQRSLQDEYLELLKRPVVPQLLRANPDSHAAHLPIGTDQVVLRKPPFQPTRARRLVKTVGTTTKVTALIWDIDVLLTLAEILMAPTNGFLANIKKNEY